MPTPFVISVAGGSGSGKTTIVNLIKEQCHSSSHASDLLVFTQDHYYRDLSHLPVEDRNNVNFDHPDSIDIELMSEHLQALLKGKSIQRPTYDFATHTRAKQTVELASADIILIDGIFSLYFESLRSLANLKLYVDVSDDIRFIRRLKRDMQQRGRSMDSVIAQYFATVRPMHREYVESSKVFADLIILWEQSNTSTIERLVKMLAK